MILFIMEWGLVHILELGVVLRGLMGKLFIETVITGGRGDRVSFLPISSLRLSNELHSPSSHLLCLKNNFPSLHEGHITG